MHGFLILLMASFMSYLLLRIAIGPLNIIKGNPYAVLFYYIIFFTVIGSLLVNLTNIQLNYFKLLTHEIVILTTYLVSYSLIAFALGVWFAVILTKKNLSNLYTNIKMSKGNFFQRISLTITSIALLIISILVSIYVYINIPIIPFTKILSSPLEIAQSRILASRSFGGIVYIKNILGLNFVPLASCIIFTIYLIYKTKILRLIFFLSLITTILMLTYNLAKAPVILYLISLLIIYGYSYGYNFKFVKRNIGLFSLIFVTITLMYVFIMGVELKDIFNINNPESLVFRVLLGQVQPLFLHFYTFPDYIPFQMGSSNFSFIGTEKTEIPARLLMEFVNPWGVQGGTAGVANSYYISEAWANFGYTGVILIPFFFGFILHMVYILLLLKPNPVKVGVLGYISVQIAAIAHSSATRLFYNPEILGSLIVILVCVGIGNMFAKITVSSRRKFF